MEYKILDEIDLEFMLDFVDDQNTKYTIDNLKIFINDKYNYAFIAKENNKIISFAYGYLLNHPDRKNVFYLDSIDVIKDYQNKGIGSKLMIYIKDYIKNINCSEMFLVTNKRNVSACKCYEKSGARSISEDDIVYIYDFSGDK